MSFLAKARASGKNLDPNIPLEEQNNVTLIEKVSLALARIGGMFGTTLTGTLATTFLYEIFFADKAGVTTETVASVSQVITTINTFFGIILPLVAGIIVTKWCSKWGHYRQWLLICSVPLFVLSLSFYWVPDGWSVEKMSYLRYCIAAFTTIVNAFYNLSQNIIQVITPNYKEKKSIATLWQISYYIGYGLAYLSPEIFKIFIPKGDPRYSDRYLVLTLVAASIALVGNLMTGFICKERIETAKKPKVKLSKELFTLFKYKNYRANQYMAWVNVLANLGKFSTLLAGITVGSSNVILLTVPTAAGTVVGNITCGILVKKNDQKYEPTKILKFCGVYSMVAAIVLFGICYGEKVMGINFWEGWTAVFFYIFYFLFGVGVGFQELSNSHFTAEYYDYLEWQTGERLEAVQGIIPGWINSLISYGKDMLVPMLLVWIAYPVSDDSTIELVDVIKQRIASGVLTQNEHLSTCMWLLAFLVFGYAFSNLFKALILKFMYNVEGETKIQMYKDLEKMRAERHIENEEISNTSGE